MCSIKIITAQPISKEQRGDIHGNIGTFDIYRRTLFGNSLRAKRRELRFSIMDVSKICGLKPSIISGIEFGKYLFETQDDFDFLIKQLEDTKEGG